MSRPKKSTKDPMESRSATKRTSTASRPAAKKLSIAAYPTVAGFRPPKGDRFPYKRFWVTDKSIWLMHQRLHDFDCDSRLIVVPPYTYRGLPSKDMRFNSKHHALISSVEDYRGINMLSDMFNEPARMDCRVRDHETPREYFEAHKVDMNSYTPLEFREIIQRNTTECTTFRPWVISCFAKWFNAPKVIDSSAGWGDRLIGAIASPFIKEYHAWDPNPAVHVGYNAIRKFFRVNAKKYPTICCPFEDAVVEENAFDMLFSSPPFFDKEEYVPASAAAEAAAQSMSRFRTEREWYDGFLKVLLQKGVYSIKSGGHFCLYIDRTRPTEQYMAWMFADLEAFETTFLGAIAITDPNQIARRPIFIWQKK
jgi:hypothetical protein